MASAERNRKSRPRPRKRPLRHWPAPASGAQPLGEVVSQSLAHSLWVRSAKARSRVTSGVFLPTKSWGRPRRASSYWIQVGWARCRGREGLCSDPGKLRLGVLGHSPPVGPNAKGVGLAAGWVVFLTPLLLLGFPPAFFFCSPARLLGS